MDKAFIDDVPTSAPLIFSSFSALHFFAVGKEKDTGLSGYSKLTTKGHWSFFSLILSLVLSTSIV